MIGIVIVSHSKKLAAGVQELAQQMVQGANALRFAIAAGIDDPENPFGTDATQIYQAIESVYTDEGVVVLMDLGSAVLSAEMALEFLSQEQRHKVRLCEAPLVEGTLAAVVQAANGADIEQVIAEARGALAAKAAQLSGVPSTESEEMDVGRLNFERSTPQPLTFVGQPITEIHFTVRNQMGLHARPAAKFVATAARFQCDIHLRNVTSGSKSVNAKSINQVITLGVRQGDEIAIAAFGSDATEALAALQHLAEANFGETSVEPLSATSVAQTSTRENAQLYGIPASPGIAIAPLVMYKPVIIGITKQQADDPQDEWQQLQIACSTTHEQIHLLRHKAATHGKQEAAIFDAHLLFLEDPALLETAQNLIFVKGMSAAAAWQSAIDETVAAYRDLPDSYLQSRAADVFDVGQQVLQLLTDTQIAPLDLKEPAILVATDLTPSQTAQLEPSKVLGICTVEGSATSHSGILARSLGIPAVVGVGTELLQLENGTLMALDGETGQVWVQPDHTHLQELQAKRDRHLAAQQQRKAAAVQQLAITRDGRQVKVTANISGIADAQIAIDNGAEGVGLLRSEFLYLDRVSAPTEEEQVLIYEAIAKTLSSRPVVIRILDIGGDKSLPYLKLAPEANPFLGWRGIRVLLDYPDLLKTQLRAILRTSYQHPIKVMLPMVASVGEIRAAKTILTTAQAELRQAGIPFNEAIEIGIMVEVPAAVAIADQLAEEVDFFSIGTNDLSQYMMAADRTNPKVAPLADAFEPAVLRMIQQTVKAAHQAGIWVEVCGELASSPLATPILVGLGVDELSMNSTAIPAVKAAISKLTISEAEAIAEAMLQLDCAEAVRQYAAAW